MSESLDSFIRGAARMPALPTQIGRLYSAIRGPSHSAGEIGALITPDPTLSAKALKMSNSVFYSRLEPVLTIRDAVVRLGFKTIRSLVTMVWTQTLKSEAKDRATLGFVEHVLNHGTACAVAAGALMRHKAPEREEECFVAALLHDIGRVVLACHIGTRYLIAIGQASDCETTACEIELNMVGFTHAQLGSRLMEKWHLPDFYAHAARDHHRADIDYKADALTAAVALGDAIATRRGWNVHNQLLRKDEDDLLKFFGVHDLEGFSDDCSFRLQALQLVLSD